MDIYTRVNEELGGRVKENVNLAHYSTFKLGGKAQYYFEATSDEDLQKSYKTAKKYNIPFTILGGISNVVIDEQGLKGLVVRNRNAYKTIIADTSDYVLIKVGSGFIVNMLVKETAEVGYEGLEYQMGLPGTIGGAVFMNSKWTRPNSYVGDVVESVIVLDKDGSFVERDKEYLHFSYGHSHLQETKEIIVSILFKLRKDDPVTLKQRAQFALEYRKKTQPFGVATSGCFFKNVNGISAGKLIDEAGLKGFHIGGVHVSEKHANFIINDGNGTVKELKELLEIIKKKVHDKLGVQLKEEVILLHT